MNPRQRQHGFATMTAVILLGFVAVALTLLTTSLGMEGRRTRQTIATQQIHQLLFAGVIITQKQMQATNHFAAGEAALPGEFADEQAKIVIEPGEISGDLAKARVTARVGRYKISERVEFKRVGDVWKIERVDLE